MGTGSYFYICLFVAVTAIFAQDLTKQLKQTYVNYCESGTCGKGVCTEKTTGNRCSCPDGWMGVECKRPCQDAFKTCNRWRVGGRCSWGKTTGNPFFDDNCAASCKRCVVNKDNALKHPIPVFLEHISWIMGKWETVTHFGDRFPLPLKFPYKETLIFATADTPMFDRPPINYTAVATLLNKADGFEHKEFGFLVSKPFNEDHGFDLKDKPNSGHDQAAMLLNSNTGLSTVEEGIIVGHREFILTLNFTNVYSGSPSKALLASERVFKRVDGNMLQETGALTLADGSSSRYMKVFNRVVDYLDPAGDYNRIVKDEM